MPSFDDFLAALASRKRKAIRKERAAALEGLEIARTDAAPRSAPAEWDAFWGFYQDTGARKWGQPYLTRDFFDLIGAAMGDRVLLFLARPRRAADRGRAQLHRRRRALRPLLGLPRGRAVPAFRALLLPARSTGRSRAASRSVEAGAQGEHKIARGYEPVVDPVGALHSRPGLPRGGRRFPRARARRGPPRKSSGCGAPCPIARPASA